MFLCFFFFQAEDGIRDDLVTGVQTCALPIFCKTHSSTLGSSPHLPVSVYGTGAERTRYEAFLGSMIRTSWLALRLVSPSRSEERRVGKECRSRWWRAQYKKKTETRICEDLN